MERKNTVLLCAMLIALLACSMWLLYSPADTAPSGLTGGLYITEICPKNETVIVDNAGKFSDYIELYNSGDPMDLSGCRLTNGTESIVLDDMFLGAEEYRILFLGQRHNSFSLDASGGDTILLLCPDGTVLAEAVTQRVGTDQVMLLHKGHYRLSSTPSPGFPNTAEGVQSFLQGQVSVQMPVVINEILASNCSALPDENGSFCDVVELYNRSGSAVNLSGWRLSDSAENRYRFHLPSVTIPAGGYLLLYCDGENRTTEAGQIHTNFGLAYGESLYLTDPQGNYHWAAPAYDQANCSVSLSFDGTYRSSAPSLGYANTAEGIDAFTQSRSYEGSPLLISQVLLSASGVPYDGALQDVVEVTNFSESSVSTAGWYLTDSDDPRQFPLPAVILSPGESFVLPCSKEITGFSLSSGEMLRLFSPDMLVASCVSCESSSGQSIHVQDALTDVSYTFGPVTLGQLTSATLPQGLIFSECMSSNHAYLAAADKSFCDWIELYNNSGTVIQLSDYSISSNANSLFQYTLPEKTLNPGEYLCVLLSEDGSGLRAGYNSLPFSLSAEGELLYLSKGSVITDFMQLPALGSNEAYGRPQGESSYRLLKKPTPGKVNAAASIVSDTVTAVTAPGVYEDVQSLEITLSAPGEIYYTTDCTVPNRGSKHYSAPIRITKTTVLRVICYEEGKAASKILDLTYLLNEGDSLSAISIVAEPNHLWGNLTGIYQNGPGWTESFPHRGANFWEDWEYPATITMFDQDGTGFTSVPFGLKIYGGFSRGFGKKSLACMFRAKYGASSLDYPIFGTEGLESYEAIVLRAGGQEVFTNRIKDEVITSYVNAKLGIPVQKYRPVVVYLNGKYFGIHFIREKINENYVSGNYGARKEDVQLTYWSGKYNAVYRELINYMKTNRLIAQEHYDYIASRVDLQNYTDYVITQMWIANEDTANVKFFSTPDQPWTWILYDTDMSMYNPALDSLIEQLKPSQLRNNDVGCKTLLLLLLENESYREYFLERMAWQVNNVWNAEDFIAHVDAVAAEVAADIPKECERWHGSYASWERQVERIRNFARERLPYFLDSIQRHFDLTDAEMKAYGFILPDS